MAGPEDKTATAVSEEEEKDDVIVEGAAGGVEGSVKTLLQAAKRKRWETSSLSDTLTEPQEQEAVALDIRRKSANRSLLHTRTEALAARIDVILGSEASAAALDALHVTTRAFEVALNDAKDAHNRLMSFLIDIGTTERELRKTDEWLLTLDRHALDLEARIASTQTKWQKDLAPEMGDDENAPPPSVMDMSIISQNATKAHAESIDKVLRELKRMPLEDNKRRDQEFLKVQASRDETMKRTQDALVQGMWAPKITVPIFSGKITEDYNGWIQRFQNVYKVESLGAETCFGELQNHLDGEAKQTLEGIKCDRTCMQVALRLLQDRYGDDKLNYSRIAVEFRKLDVCSSMNEPAKLRALYNTISAMHRSGEAIGKSGDSTMIAMWLEKLPIQVHEAWEKKMVKSTADPDDCKQFVEDLRITVRVREGIAPAVKLRAEVKAKEKKLESKEQKASAAASFAQVAAAPAAARALVAQTDGGAKPKAQPQAQQQGQQQQQGPRRKPKPKDQAVKETGIDYGNCAMCEDSHNMANCKLFTGKPLQDRWEQVKLKRCCMSCLRRGHSKWQCRTKAECTHRGCTQLHHPLLHG